MWPLRYQDGDFAPDSFYIESAQSLPKGNTLITSGLTGQVLEVVPDKAVLWAYRRQYMDVWLPD